MAARITPSGAIALDAGETWQLAMVLLAGGVAIDTTGRSFVLAFYDQASGQQIAIAAGSPTMLQGRPVQLFTMTGANTQAVAAAAGRLPKRVKLAEQVQSGFTTLWDCSLIVAPAPALSLGTNTDSGAITMVTVGSGGFGPQVLQIDLVGGISSGGPLVLAAGSGHDQVAAALALPGQTVRITGAVAIAGQVAQHPTSVLELAPGAVIQVNWDSPPEASSGGSADPDPDDDTGPPDTTDTPGTPALILTNVRAVGGGTRPRILVPAGRAVLRVIETGGEEFDWSGFDVVYDGQFTAYTPGASNDAAVRIKHPGQITSVMVEGFDHGCLTYADDVTHTRCGVQSYRKGFRAGGGYPDRATYDRCWTMVRSPSANDYVTHKDISGDDPFGGNFGDDLVVRDCQFEDAPEHGIYNTQDYDRTSLQLVTSLIGSIAETTLTVTSVLSGAVAIGLYVFAAGQAGWTQVVAPIAANTNGTGTWQVQPWIDLPAGTAFSCAGPFTDTRSKGHRFSGVITRGAWHDGMKFRHLFELEIAGGGAFDASSRGASFSGLQTEGIDRLNAHDWVIDTEDRIDPDAKSSNLGRFVRACSGSDRGVIRSVHGPALTLQDMVLKGDLGNTVNPLRPFPDRPPQWMRRFTGEYLVEDCEAGNGLSAVIQFDHLKASMEDVRIRMHMRNCHGMLPIDWSGLVSDSRYGTPIADGYKAIFDITYDKTLHEPADFPDDPQIICSDFGPETNAAGYDFAQLVAGTATVRLAHATCQHGYTFFNRLSGSPASPYGDILADFGNGAAGMIRGVIIRSPTVLINDPTAIWIEGFDQAAMLLPVGTVALFHCVGGHVWLLVSLELPPVTENGDDELAILAARPIVSGGTIQALPTDTMLIVNKAIPGPTPITLPPQPVPGRVLIIKDARGDADVNPITVSGGTIDGQPSAQISAPFGRLWLIPAADGLSWSSI